MKLSHFYNVKNKNKYMTANADYFLVITEGKTKDRVMYLFTENDLVTAFERAAKNKEDIPPEAYSAEKPMSFIALFLMGLVSLVAGSGLMFFLLSRGFL